MLAQHHPLLFVVTKLRHIVAVRPCVLCLIADNARCANSEAASRHDKAGRGERHLKATNCLKHRTGGGTFVDFVKRKLALGLRWRVVAPQRASVGWDHAVRLAAVRISNSMRSREALNEICTSWLSTQKTPQAPERR